MESTMTSSGATDSMCPNTAPRSVSAASRTRDSMAPMRSARSRTCPADSSPLTYSTVRPARAVRAATSSSKVDLPTPGSPASNTTAPATSPPPRTRSNSPTPVPWRWEAVATTSVTGTAGVADAVALVAGPDATAPTSTTVPHAWHSPQRPTHFAAVHPHSVHR